MLRVGNLQRSIDVYTQVLGMQLLRVRDNPEYKYTLAFLGYGPEESSTVFELTYNYGKTSYDRGGAYAQVAISTQVVGCWVEAGGVIQAILRGSRPTVPFCQAFIRPLTHRRLCPPPCTGCVQDSGVGAGGGWRGGAGSGAGAGHWHQNRRGHRPRCGKAGGGSGCGGGAALRGDSQRCSTSQHSPLPPPPPCAPPLHALPAAADGWKIVFVDAEDFKAELQQPKSV